MKKTIALVASAAIALTTLAIGSPAEATSNRDVKVTLKRVCATDGATKVRLKLTNPNTRGGEKYVSYQWSFSDTGVSSTSTWLRPQQTRRDGFRLVPGRSAHVVAGPGESFDGTLLDRTVRPLDC